MPVDEAGADALDDALASDGAAASDADDAADATDDGATSDAIAMGDAGDETGTVFVRTCRCYFEDPADFPCLPLCTNYFEAELNGCGVGPLPPPDLPRMV
jgi:hypothetical protein